MKQFIVDNMDVIIAAITAATGLMSAIAAWIVNLTLHRSNRCLEEKLKKVKERETYTVCPHCKKEIPFSDLSFFLPGGLPDQNLDGKED